MISSDSKVLFHVEPLAPVIENIKGLLSENHEETGVFDLPFNPDFDRYLMLDANGDSIFFTARTHAGNIVGFALFFLDTSIQQKDIVAATQSLNFIAKSHRGVGYAFMRFCDDILKKQGVNSVWRQASTKFDISPIYERMGYTLVEKTYLRRL